ncbi:IS3 family transposase [Rathayibacter soli]|uniref:IS3 family transposase n=1 Tax=Rathayibacter soli TaxID=3144168 RepID=UPI0027E512E1|nr:IS3 family transposase [Glaciibacter superstes]
MYGVRKMPAALRRAGEKVAESTARQLMKAHGLRGLLRAKGPRTTKLAAETDRPRDLVDWQFFSPAVNRPLVADITYVRTFSGGVYAAFVLDVFSRMVGGWQVATSLYTDLTLDALKMAIWRREREGADLSGLVHHSDRAVQNRAITYTERLAEAEAVASVGSKGDSYDNAMAEAFNSLFKAELIRNRGPWAGIDDLEIAVAEYIDWYNSRRLHSELRHIPLAEYEALHAVTQAAPTLIKTNQTTLYETRHLTNQPGLRDNADRVADLGGPVPATHAETEGPWPHDDVADHGAARANLDLVPARGSDNPPDPRPDRSPQRQGESRTGLRDHLAQPQPASPPELVALSRGCWGIESRVPQNPRMEW